MRIRLARLVAAGVVLIGMVALVTALTAASSPVRLISPAPGARVSGTIQVTAQVDLPETSYVVFGIDQQRPCSTNSQPYVCNLDTAGLSDGVHYLWAEAYSRYGLLATSPQTKVFVSNGSGVAPKPKPVPSPAPVLSPKPKAVRPSAPALAPKPKPVPSPAPVVAPKPKPALPSAPVIAPPPAPVIQPKPSGGAEVFSSVAEAPDRLTDSQPKSASPAPTTAPAMDGELVRQALRSSGISIELAGEDVTRTLCPVIRSNRTHVRFRPLFQMLATRVHWDASRHRAIAFAPGLRIEVPIGSNTAIVNGQQVDLGGQAWISDGRTMLPVRFCLQAVAGTLQYDATTRCVALAMPSDTQALKPP